jgi:hypothetical protein
LKLVERYYPIIFSILIITGLVFFKNLIKEPSVLIDKITDNALTISVTLLGFFLTILTIVNSVDTRRMRFIKSDGLYPRLIGFLNDAIKANVFLIAFSFAVKYLDYRHIKFFCVSGINVIDYAYLFYFIFSLLISYRFTDIFVRLLADPKK